LSGTERPLAAKRRVPADTEGMRIDSDRTSVTIDVIGARGAGKTLVVFGMSDDDGSER
jgi:hypothetical protein